MRVDGWASDVHLAVTGLSRSQRVAIEALINRGGGTYTASLSRRNTHLLVPDTDIAPTPKVQAAMAKGRAWGLTVVTLAWALDSDRQQRRQPETGYAVTSASSERPLAERVANAEAGPVAAVTVPYTPTKQLADTLAKLSLSRNGDKTPASELTRGLQQAGGRVTAQRGAAVVAAGGPPSPSQHRE